MNQSGLPKSINVIFDEAGILVRSYNNNFEYRLLIDISGSYDKKTLKELKKKVRSLKI